MRVDAMASGNRETYGVEGQLRVEELKQLRK